MLNVPPHPVRPLSSPTVYLVRMAVFLILCGFLILILFRQLQAAFFGNPGLNGLILGLLAIGVLIALVQVARLYREVAWVNHASGASSRLARPPRLLGPVAALIGDAESRSQLSVTSMRSLLDSISARLEENRELVRYLAGLLVFLGLLGTFWGLIETVNSVGRIIGSLKSGGEASVLFDDLKNALAAPLSGMGVSFSASLFGLASSLVLGFLDLQAGQAQARFYNEVEDWLAVGVSGDERAIDLAAPPAVGTAPAVGIAPATASPDLAAALDRVAAAVGDGSGTRDAALAMANLAEGVQALVQHVRSEQQILRGFIDQQAYRDRELKTLIEQLAREQLPREKVG